MKSKCLEQIITGINKRLNAGVEEPQSAKELLSEKTTPLTGPTTVWLPIFRHFLKCSSSLSVWQNKCLQFWNFGLHFPCFARRKLGSDIVARAMYLLTWGSFCCGGFELLFDWWIDKEIRHKHVCPPLITWWFSGSVTTNGKKLQSVQGVQNY